MYYFLVTVTTTAGSYICVLTNVRNLKTFKSLNSHLNGCLTMLQLIEPITYREDEVPSQ